MQENQLAPRVGRETLVAHERRVLSRAESVRSTCVRPVFVSGNRVVIRWIFEFEWKDGSATRAEELAYQLWQDELYVHLVVAQSFRRSGVKFRRVRAAKIERTWKDDFAFINDLEAAGYADPLVAMQMTAVTSERTSQANVDGIPHPSVSRGAGTLTRLAFQGLLALAAGILIAPTVLGDEPEPRVRIGILSSLNTLALSTTKKFLQELERLGYVDGVNLTIDSRFADDQPARLPELARDLVRLKPDVIFTLGTTESTAAAMRATSTIPIVFIHAVDPVRAGLVASLSRPGGNVTGVTSLNADLGAKRLELVTEIVPGVRRVAVLVYPVDPETPPMLQAVASAARARRIQLDLQEIRDPAGLSGAVADAAKGRAGALLVLGSPPLYRHSLTLAQLAAKHRLPTVSAWREFPEAGGLASYGTNLSEMFQRAAGLVDRILKGAKPAELPVEQPTKFELVVNLKTAKAFGLKIPQSILQRADEVIR